MGEGTGRVVVLTGASSGIGKAAACALAARGFRVIATGRDRARAAAAEAEIAAAAQDAGSVTMIVADLSLLAEAERLAAAITALTDRIDVLINNAGAMADRQVMTAEGLEANFAGNFLGPFVLTERLSPLLLKAASDSPTGAVRIINTSSDGSEMIPALDLDDMQSLAQWSPGGAYCSGKLANVLHARALAKRLGPKGIVAHSVHPGTVGSNFFAHVPRYVRDIYEDAPKLSNEEGADALVWLATAREAGDSNGLYWFQRAVRTPNPVVEDDAFVDRFWQAAEALVATADRKETNT